MDLLERALPAPPSAPAFAPGTELDEAAARRSLRTQIGRLERELATVACTAYPNVDLAARAAAGRAGPRLLSLGDLELVRDELAERLHALRAELGRLADRQAAKRLLIERMLLEPARYKWVRVTNEDLGETGCKSWHVRPRLGLIGMLMGWWRVKISSGCPLAWGPWRPPRPRSSPSAPDGAPRAQAHGRRCAGRRLAPPSLRPR